jgi:hypothetical protein
LVVGLFQLFINLLFLIILVIGLIYAVYSNETMGDTTKYRALLVVYIISAVFISYFFYYLSVFVVATSVANWYFQNDRSVFYGYCTAFYNVGSLSFCSVIITIIITLRMLVSMYSNSQNGIAACLVCLVKFILSCLQGLL